MERCVRYIVAGLNNNNRNSNNNDSDTNNNNNNNNNNSNNNNKRTRAFSKLCEQNHHASKDFTRKNKQNNPRAHAVLSNVQNGDNDTARYLVRDVKFIQYSTPTTKPQHKTRLHER